MSISEVVALVWAVCSLSLVVRTWASFHRFFKSDGFDAYIFVLAIGGLVMSPLLFCVETWRFIKHKYTIRRCR